MAFGGEITPGTVWPLPTRESVEIEVRKRIEGRSSEEIVIEITNLVLTSVYEIVLPRTEPNTPLGRVQRRLEEMSGTTRGDD